MRKNDDDILIGKGLKLVRKGIVGGSWDIVCQGYNLISGEELEPAQKKTRLEIIREEIQKDDDSTIIHATELPQEIYRSKDTITSIELPTDRLPDEEGIVPAIKTQKGGKRFGQGEITVISTAPDAKEMEQNRNDYKKAPVSPKARGGNVLELFAEKDEDAPVRFSGKNKRVVAD